MLNENYINDIQIWCSENEIIDKCEQNFWKCFNNYKLEETKEFLEKFQGENSTDVHLILDKVKLCQNYQLHYSTPTVEIDFDIMLEKVCVGWYREVYFLNGEFIEEHFVIE